MVTRPDRKISAPKPRRLRDVSGFSARQLHPASDPVDLDTAVERYTDLEDVVIDLTDSAEGNGDRRLPSRSADAAHVVDVRLILSDGREVL